MTISKIYIGAFGGLSDFTLTFSDGFQVLYGENENGKSTVMAFLKMMFYGGKGGKSGDLSKMPRVKYRPWDGGTMGGRVYFEQGGRRYCLEREFRASDSTDRVLLRDLDLGTSEDVASDVGARVFGIGAGAFEHSVFIGQPGASVSDSAADGELNAKLSNLALTGDEDTSFQTVSGRLLKAEQTLMTARNAGLYDRGVVRLQSLREELKNADETEQRRTALTARREELKKRLIAEKTQYDAAKKTVDSENDVRSAEKLREYLKTKEQLDRLNETLRLRDGTLADSAFLSKIEFCASKCENARQRAAERQQEAEQLQKTISLAESPDADPAHAEKLRGMIEQLTAQSRAAAQESAALADRVCDAENALEQAREKVKKPSVPMIIAGGLFILLAAAGFLIFKSAAISGGLLACAAVLVLMGFLFHPGAKRTVSHLESELNRLRENAVGAKAEETALQAEINKQTAAFNLLTAALNTDKTVREQRSAELTERLEAAKQAQFQAAEAQTGLDTLFAAFPEAPAPAARSAMLTDLKARTEEQKQLKLQLKYLSSDLGGISYEDARNKLTQIGASALPAAVDFDAAKSELDRLNGEVSALSGELSAVTAELNTGFRGTQDPEALGREIEALETRLAAQKRFCEATKLAREVLTDSFAEVRRSYGSVLEQKTRELFSRLTNGRYQSVSVSDAFVLNAEPAGSFRLLPAEALSTGTADQAYLSLRLALSSLLSGGEKLPVLLDDVLAQYDDGRTAEALSALREYGESGQAVLFTCHGAVCEAAKNAGIPVLPLNGQKR